jgi:hypothetical protein
MLLLESVEAICGGNRRVPRIEYCVIDLILALNYIRDLDLYSQY